jgi:hypothetical protein
MSLLSMSTLFSGADIQICQSVQLVLEMWDNFYTNCTTELI